MQGLPCDVCRLPLGPDAHYNLRRHPGECARAHNRARVKAQRAATAARPDRRECARCQTGFEVPASSVRRLCDGCLAAREFVHACLVCGAEVRSGSPRPGRCEPCDRAYNAERSRRWQANYRARNGKTYAHDRYPGARKVQAQARRALRAKATVEPFTRRDLLASWEERGLYACSYCGGPYEHDDHALPLARGGAHAVGNLVPACRECNLAKSTKTAHEFAGRL